MKKGEKAKIQVEAWREYKRENPIKTKEIQLRKVFKTTLEKHFTGIKGLWTINDIVEKLIKEVTMRVKL